MADYTNQSDQAETTATNTFAAKATDLEALRDAVVDAASVSGGLWLSYLFALFYFAIATGAVTHRDLLFKSPVKLPFLNVELPLLYFFGLGPLVFLVVHAYVLLHFLLLAGKVGAFHVELQKQVPGDGIRAQLRRQLPSNIFVQFLAGPRDVRGGIIGILLRLVAVISLVLGPIAVLVLFQLQFLPFHNPWITWWQRIAVVLDLVLLWLLWPPIARGENALLTWKDLGRAREAAYLTASLLVLFLVFTIATFRGEWLEKQMPTIRLVPTSMKAWQLPSMEAIQKAGSGWATLHELLVAGPMDVVAQRPKSLWSNRLVLPGIDVNDRTKLEGEAKTAGHTESVSLRGRRLEGAVLSDAHLRKIDLTGAQLEGAVLAGADLREAKFGPWRTGFTAGLNVTESGADLRGAVLISAQLQGANLNDAELEGADLTGATLQGALLSSAHLQGAILSGAQLQGAILIWIDLEGADLSYANLQNAKLYGAWLQGTRLYETKLQGALLSQAQLQGASLTGADLTDASLDGIFVWRANVQQGTGNGAFVISPETAPKYVSSHCTGACPSSDWSPSSFAALKQLIERQVPEGARRDEALKQIAVLDPAKLFPEEEASAKVWADLAASSPSPDDYEKGRAKWLRATSCDARGAPFVIRQLLLLRDLDPFNFVPGSPQPAVLATAFLDEVHCPGAHGLSDEEKYQLQMLRDQPAPAPK
jgi:uncharacterized protein YjbI with pentapeptide repeats